MKFFHKFMIIIRYNKLCFHYNLNLNFEILRIDQEYTEV